VLLHKQCNGPLEPSDQVENGAVYDSKGELIVLGYYCAICRSNVFEERDMIVEDIEVIK
jgi:hypothetical protein